MAPLILGHALVHSSMIILQHVNIQGTCLGIHFKYRNSILIVHNSAIVEVPLNVDGQVSRCSDALHADCLPRIRGRLAEAEWL